jgi:hypothetical protein
VALHAGKAALLGLRLCDDEFWRAHVSLEELDTVEGYKTVPGMGSFFGPHGEENCIDCRKLGFL